MISSTTTGQETTEGRSVRDIAEHAHGEVDDAWCRKLFRQLLQSLERQYAMDMPHRAITADTVVFHQNGEPLLLPSIVSDPAPSEADDLTALAKLIHYAVTQELMPTGPLHGRGLEGYSDALLTAVDRCMDPDPARRPQSIAELRDILGIVAPGSAPLPPPPPLAELSDPAPAPAPEQALPAPPVPSVPSPVMSAPTSPPVPPVPPAPQPPAAAAPAQALRASADSTPTTAEPAGQTPAGTRPRGAGSDKRWAVPVAIGAIVLAILFAGYTRLHGNAPSDDTAPARPEAAGQAQADGITPAGPAAPAAAGAGTARTSQPEQPAPAQDAATLPAPMGTSTTPAAATPADPAGPAASGFIPAPGNTGGGTAGAATGAAAAPANPNAGATYRLQIQPWGTVYVDGIDRGVSPPVKRLQLPPGRHTVRVTNPNFHERVLEVDTTNGDGRIVVDFSSAE